MVCAKRSPIDGVKVRQRGPANMRCVCRHGALWRRAWQGADAARMLINRADTAWFSFMPSPRRCLYTAHASVLHHVPFRIRIAPRPGDMKHRRRRVPLDSVAHYLMEEEACLCGAAFSNARQYAARYARQHAHASAAPRRCHVSVMRAACARPSAERREACASLTSAFKAPIP